MRNNKCSVKISAVIAALITILFSACKKEYNSSLNCKLIEVTQLVNNLSPTWTFTYDSQGRLSSCTSPSSGASPHHNYIYTNIVTEMNIFENGSGSFDTSITKFALNLNGNVFYSSEIYSESFIDPYPMTFYREHYTSYTYNNSFLTYVKNEMASTTYIPTDTFYSYNTRTITRTILNGNCIFQIDSSFSGYDQDNLNFYWSETTKYEYSDKLNNQNIDFAYNNLSPSLNGMGSGYNSKIFGKSNKNLISKYIHTDSQGVVSIVNFQYEFNQYNYISKYIISDSTDTLSYVFKYNCGF